MHKFVRVLDKYEDSLDSGKGTLDKALKTSAGWLHPRLHTEGHLVALVKFLRNPQIIGVKIVLKLCLEESLWHFAFPLPLPSCNVTVVPLFELPIENNKHPNFEWRRGGRGVYHFALQSYAIRVQLLSQQFSCWLQRNVQGCTWPLAWIFSDPINLQRNSTPS